MSGSEGDGTLWEAQAWIAPLIEVKAARIRSHEALIANGASAVAGMPARLGTSRARRATFGRTAQGHCLRCPGSWSRDDERRADGHRVKTGCRDHLF